MGSVKGMCKDTRKHLCGLAVPKANTARTARFAA